MLFDPPPLSPNIFVMLTDEMPHCKHNKVKIHRLWDIIRKLCLSLYHVSLNLLINVIVFCLILYSRSLTIYKKFCFHEWHMNRFEAGKISQEKVKETRDIEDTPYAPEAWVPSWCYIINNRKSQFPSTMYWNASMLIFGKILIIASRDRLTFFHVIIYYRIVSTVWTTSITSDKRE